jgi:hypothetical protein
MYLKRLIYVYMYIYIYIYIYIYVYMYICILPDSSSTGSFTSRGVDILFFLASFTGLAGGTFAKSSFVLSPIHIYMYVYMYIYIYV